MIVYKTAQNHRSIPQGTRFVFVRSKQLFKSTNNKFMITNQESRRFPGLIEIDEEILKEKKRKNNKWRMKF